MAYHLTEDLLGEERSLRLAEKRMRDKLLRLETGAELSIDPEAELEVRLRFEEQSRQSRQSRQFIAGLSPQERELVAAKLENLSTDVITKRLGVAPSTVYNLVARVKRKFQSL